MISHVALVLWLALAQATPPATSAFQASYGRGMQALAKGELDAAEAAFRGAQRLRPRNALVYFQLAEIHAQRRQFREAIVNLRQAVVLDPREVQFHFRLAVLYAQLERFHDAQQTLKALLDRKSTRLNSSHSRASRMPSSA